MVAAGQALDYLHSKRVIHRDISLRNFICPNDPNDPNGNQEQKGDEEDQKVSVLDRKVKRNGVLICDFGDSMYVFKTPSNKPLNNPLSLSLSLSL